MTKLYSATNPQAIIDQFERMAQRADAVASAPDGPLRNKAIARREAVTWRAAADILRNTDFVGWTPSAGERLIKAAQEMRELAQTLNDYGVEIETQRDYPEELKLHDPLIKTAPGDYDEDALRDKGYGDPNNPNRR